MKNIFLRIILSTIIGSLVACSPKRESQGATDRATQATEGNKKVVDQAVVDAKKSVAVIEATLLDATASGGQPGTISLAGDLVHPDGTLRENIGASAVAGFGWRSQRPPLNANTISLKPQVALSQAEESRKLEQDDHVVNLGCDGALIQNAMRGLRELDVNTLGVQGRSVQEIRVNTIIVCDGDQLPDNVTFISARTMILHSAIISRTGTLDKMLFLNAQELILEGTNLIESNGAEGHTTLLPGPSISIGASSLKGDGSLHILTHGSNYQISPVPTSRGTDVAHPENGYEK